MRTLAKSQIEKLKSVYMELDEEILCEIFSTIIYRLSHNGVYVEIPVLSQNRIDYLIESGLAELVDSISKEPIVGNIRIDFSKHDDGILLEFVHKVMNEKEQGKKGGMKMTNFERIKGMSVEELAKFLLKVNTAYPEPCMTGKTDCKREDYPTHDKGCKDCFKEWLESECDVE